MNPEIATWKSEEAMLNLLRSASNHPKLPVLVVVLAALLGLTSQAHSQCGNPANAIVAENCLTGNPASEWDIGAGSIGDPTIQGFATDISVNQGSTVFFKISTPASAYTINIYRMGYYGGMGARKITTITPSAKLPQIQPACLGDSTVGLTDCGNWGVSASWQVPATATSGIYFAHLIRTDTGGDSHIVFIVRNDSSTSKILYQTSDETWQAYNYYGNGSFYSQGTPTFDLADRSYKVSYNRPFYVRDFNQEWDTWAFGTEFAMVQWLEMNGYDVTYFTGIDAARNGPLIKNHKIYMDSGHDEYWSAQQRTNVLAARDAGVNLAFFSGNTMFWKTRWENSIDGTNTANRTLVCYKETLAFAKIDPMDPPTWTGTWRDPSFSPPADGGAPENSLIGTLFMVNGTGTDNDGSLTIKVPSADGKMRFWRNTAAANLAANASYTLVPGSLGYEWDVDADNGFRPAGAFDLSTSTYSLTSDLLLDYGATYGAGTATHHMTLYRAPSGALVFSAATIDWAWGLNSNHDNLWSFNTPNPDPNMQQATVNLLADMGVQPATLQSNLVPASASTDTAPPSSNITSPANGSTLTTGSAITVKGSATDSGGGVVAGVEFSSDGGKTWHPAVGRSNWTYTWTPSVVNSKTTLMSRAVDDSANLETPLSGVSVSVQSQVCPCSIWNSSPTPVNPDGNDPTPIEVGVKFRADADGSILGVRFYKSAKNTGTHIGHVWTSSGTLLGTATFSGESSSGWQQANFTSPIAVQANTTYIVSYYTPAGHYAADSYFFAQSGVDNPPLHALASGVDGQNGVFLYPPTNVQGGFPSSSNLSANYWVDVVYTSSNTYNISGTISGPGGAGSTVTLSGTELATTTADASGNYSFNGVVNGTYTVTPSNQGVTFSPTSQSVTVNGGVVNGVNFTAVVSNPLSISGTVAGGAGATVQLSGSAVATTTADASGNYSFGGLLNGSYTITPVENGFIFTPGTKSVVLSGSNATGANFQAQLCNCISIWPSSTTPALIDSNDATPIEVGVKFRVDTPGSVTAVRFYKASTNVGSHIGHLWTSTGTLLGTATFTGESASGWQQMTFPSPIQVAANTTYIVSYYAPSGHYSADTNYFATTGADNPPLHALANGVDGANGVYLYTSSQTGAFPTNTYSATNYWVDLLYAGTQANSISGTIAGGAGATVTLSGGNGATTTADSSGNYTFNGIFPGTYSVIPSLSGVAFVPGNQNVTITSANVSGVNFTVPSICPCNTIWKPSALPATVDSGDALSYELGVKFRADSDGYILGVRFYKSATNTGTHIGHLWSPTGTNPLSAATFANESASGWQQVMFANPIPVSANSTYIASYFAPSGHYSIDSSFFATAGVDTPPLHALATGIDGANGVFSQSSTSALPTSSFNASNYWVDVIYATTTTHSLGGIVSGAGAAGATITLSGAATASTTTDSFGNYNFGGLADGTYTATPSETGYVFTPASQTVTISGAHNLSVNFASALPGYVISGTVSGGPGITVSLTGSTNVSTTTDASGNYSLPAVPNGTYTVTPSGVGYSITPTSQSVTVNGANVGSINFTAASVAYSITGTISGGAGATVTLTGASTLTTTADTSGNYSFTGVVSGTYAVTPAMSGLVFTPSNLAVTVAGANVAGANFTVPQNCPCDTIWQPSSVPTVVDDGDNQSIEVGVKLRSDTAGYITGIRFYKSAANAGVHLGNLWSSTGTLLATATFTNESSSGWQQVFFSAPVLIAANTTYVASYFAPAGRYSGDAAFFANAGVDAPPLHALANGTDGANGLYIYGASSAFPTNSGNGANYWVDAIYSPSYSITGTISGAGGAGATVNAAGPVTTSTTADASGNYSFSAMTNGSYTITPSNTGFSFAPPSQNVIVSGSNVTVPAFTASTQSFTISGTISGAGGNGATVSLGGTATATTTANAAGSYSFTGLANGSYTVTPVKSGFIMTPSSQPVTVNGANVTANFSSAAQTFTITGTISGTGGNGATVLLSGTAGATTTANASGAYTFSGLANGSYTVTPSKAGFIMTPASQGVSINGANGTANFSSAQAFTISGTISGAGGSGATVSLTGTATATTTANTSGVYSFSVANGSYTVTPSKTGYVFTPASQAVTVSGASKTANFSSAVQTFTLTGTITGPGASGATVRLTGAATATTTTNSSGAYTFSGLANGSYTVTPSRTGFIMTPTSQAVTISGANKTANFSSAQAFTISGTISGSGRSGATVTLTGAATATTTTNTSGVYSFSVANGSYTVTPSNTGFVFTPASQAVTVSGANKTANFSSAVPTFTLTGTITGSGASGATVRLTGAATATTTTNSSGAYTFSGLANGSYTVTPSTSGSTFTPTSQAVTISGANKTANFTSVAQTFTISGTISGGGGSGATVKLTGAATATTTASSSGAYSFTGVTNGSYTVTPSKSGHIYIPGNRATTVNSGNVTGLNFVSF